MSPRLALAVALSSLVLARCDCTAEPLSEAQPIAQAPEALDFGPLAEGTSQAQDVVVQNLGFATLEVTGALAAGTSADFALESPVLSISSRGTGTLPVRFSPSGPGEDAGAVVLTTNDPQTPTLEVRLHGGPIEPALEAPTEVDFSPADASIVQRTVIVRNAGLAVLEIESVLVDVGGNPNFQTDAAPDQILLPQASIAVNVTHTRSIRTDDGRLLVRSSDPADAGAGGVRAIRLIPDPLGPCEDGDDNDGDQLVDYPDDPGCADFFDASEEDAPDCVDGATQLCGSDTGLCESGLRTCVGGTFGGCDGEIGPETETCNRVNDDCDTETDEGITRGCVVNGCAGQEICRTDGSGTFTPCAAIAPGTESCNGADDDCDGLIDDSIVESCTVLPANCPGTRQCVLGGTGTFTGCAPNDPGACGLCPNGVIDAGEECDDSNSTNGDGCDDACQSETATCDADGTFLLLGPAITYQCCYFEALDFFVVEQRITAFVIAGNGTTVTGTPTGAGMGFAPQPAQCPAGTLDHTVSIPGATSCTETYSVAGTFLDANTFVGTYSMGFVGAQCDCAVLESTDPVPCTDQEFTFTARR